MSKSVTKRHQSRIARKRRVRKRVVGTEARPRLCVYRSLQHTYAQLISDETNAVIGGASTKSIVQNSSEALSGIDSAKELGKAIAQIAESKKVSNVVFDRNGYRFHGRVAAVAEGAREAGLSF